MRKMKQNKENKYFLLNTLKKILKTDNFNEIYFGYAEPLPDVPTPLNFLSRITIPTEGSNYIFASYDGKPSKRLMTPGKILFTGRNGWAYSTAESQHSCSLSVVFMKTYIRLVYGDVSYGKKLYNPWHHTSRGAQEISNNILKCLKTIMFETNTNRQSKAIPLIKALLYQVIEEVENDVIDKHSKAENTLKNIIEFTQQYYHLPINRASVSNELHLNPSSLSRIFKEQAGQNFNSYLNQLRMEKAEFILKNYDLAIEKIADQCGFTSSGYFIKAFKNYFGTTPGDFRKSSRN